MLQIEAGEVEPDQTELSSAGAFIDTVGDVKQKRKGKKIIYNELEREEEAELVALVFGRQPFQPTTSCGADSSSEESEDDLYCGSVEVRETDPTGGSKRGVIDIEQPAWRDEDDEEISVDMTEKMHRKRLRQENSDRVVSGNTYSKRLRNKFQQLGGAPEWATRGRRKGRVRERRNSDSSDSSDAEEDELLTRTGPLLSRSTHRLPPSQLDMKKMKDINRLKRAQAAVKSVEFHPTANVALTAGWHKTLDLFQVDGEVNPKLQSVHVEGFPISTAHFTQDGTEIVMAGQRKSYHVYDMIAGKITRVCGIRGRREKQYSKFTVSPDNKLLAFLGKDGYIIFVSNKTKQWIAEVKMNGEVRDVAFTTDSRHLLSFGTDGRVYVWDVPSRRCVHCFTDEGCVIGSRVGVSPNGQYVACGSESGIVNVYDMTQCMVNEAPKPLRSIGNLTTNVDSLQFNSTSELLAIASSAKKNALKIVHLSSLTVFSNWPNIHSRISHPTSLHLSPISRYLAVGNDRGKALLFRLNHYHHKPI